MPWTLPKLDDKLSKRELEVVAALRRGVSNKQGAHELGMSYYTFKQHVHNILVKTGLGSRLQIVVSDKIRS